MNAPAYMPDNREQLAAQAQAARLIVSLRGTVMEVARAMRPVRTADRALRELRPLLSVSARAEIDREIARLSTALAEAFQPSDSAD